ncbi:MAG: TPM domain-containing protein [Clostridiales bacterium]|nr:TPM domain-containing protein [Clostridiales bacterium]
MKKRISAVLFMLLMSISFAVTSFVSGTEALAEVNNAEIPGSVIGENNTIILGTRAAVADMADVLSEDEENALTARLDELRQRQRLDVAVVTVNTLDGKTAEEYADDFYDYNGYGCGDDYDGILLLINIAPDGSYTSGNGRISTHGRGIDIFTDKGIQYIGSRITPALLEGSYSEAFDEYITLCDEFIEQEKTGKPYDADNLPKGEFPLRKNLCIALISGAVIAFMITGFMKSKLNTVRFNPTASDYMKDGSLNITESRDILLYTHIDKREIKNDSSSGGSSTHTSSSGETHGGGSF